MDMPRALRLSRDAARWGVGFYLRHLVPIAGLSLIPAAQRFLAVGWGDQLPGVVTSGGEVLTAVTRVLLIGLILRLMVREAGPRPWPRFTAFIDRRPADFMLQFAVLGLAYVAFGALPNLAIERLVAPEGRDLALAVLLAVKNPTVIAFTFVWMAGVALRMIQAEPAEPAGDNDPAAAGRGVDGGG